VAGRGRRRGVGRSCRGPVDRRFGAGAHAVATRRLVVRITARADPGRDPLVDGGVGGRSSANQAAVGRDLLRAQLSVVSWTYAIKFATNRTRPNGDPRSFPSGHASTSFTVAMVLQEHFGWKVGIPAFAAAAYTGTSRVPASSTGRATSCSEQRWGWPAAERSPCICDTPQCPCRPRRCRAVWA
jgi:hypothetical protein